MGKLLKPSSKSIIYQDTNVYACLAKHSITPGHAIVAWKKDVIDLQRMPDRDYDYLMDTVFAVRNALLKTLRVKKVYLLYMDEGNHVHWHLIPRYKIKGFDIFNNTPETLRSFPLAQKIKRNLVFK